MAKHPKNTEEFDQNPVPAWSRRIAEARRARGLSQEALGKLVGASQSTVADWEKGKTHPRWRTLPLISLELGVDLMDMIPPQNRQAVEESAKQLRSEEDADSAFADLVVQLLEALSPLRGPYDLRTCVKLARLIWRRHRGTEDHAPDRAALSEAVANTFDLMKQLDATLDPSYRKP